MPESTHEPRNTRLIRRKLAIPETDHRTSRRPRVEALVLDALEQSRVLLVSGAAGSGKTTAVADALGGVTYPVAWLSLDGAESAPGRFLLYLEAATSEITAESVGAASDALSAGLPIGEAAGLLAESLYATRLALVIDSIERVLQSPEALEVLSALARYMPSTANLVLISRDPIELDLDSALAFDHVTEIGDRELAFTELEAAAALRVTGQANADAAELVRLADGWVTGVLYFGAEGGARTPARLRRYLADQVLATLDSDEIALLVRASLVPEITGKDARALGIEDGQAILDRIRRRHLPVYWQANGSLRIGHHLREVLLAQFEQLPTDTIRTIKHQLAHLLVDRGETEDAIDMLLGIGAIGEAWELATRVMPSVVARMDLPLAARWLGAMVDILDFSDPRVAWCILRVAFGLEQPLRGAELLERGGLAWVVSLASSGEAEVDESLALLAWCLWHAGDIDSVRAVIEQMRPGRARAIATGLLGLSSADKPTPLPPLDSANTDPLEGLLQRVAYFRGKFAYPEVEETSDPWRTAVSAPWVVAGLRSTGRLDEALAWYEANRNRPHPLWLHAVDAPELMADLGRTEDARDSVARAWQLQRESGSKIYKILLHISEARIHLRLDEDWLRADAAIARAESAGAMNYAFTAELVLMIRGDIALRRGDANMALPLLDDAVARMRRSERSLELPAAATLLSEAAWRTGREEAADEAAGLALAAAEDADSVHLLLVALEHLPEVAVRSSDAEIVRGGRWHELVALLARRPEHRSMGRGVRVVLEEFGESALMLDGEDVTPRLRKSAELLSRLLVAPDGSATRDELVSGLFESRSEPAARSYLRQALYRLREVLPIELAPRIDGEHVYLPNSDATRGSSGDIVASIVDAGRQGDEERARTLVSALARTERGPFLQRATSPWAEARRTELDQLLLNARLDLARVTFRLGRYWESASAVSQVLKSDPYREEAWLLRMSLAHANGIDDGVLATYQRYLAAMQDLGVPPSAEVLRQLHVLRA